MRQHAARIALVTGAASGIGRSIADALALEDGATIGIVDRDGDGARAAASEIARRGGRAQAFVADLASADALLAALAELEGALGAPDIVVNNAGIAATAPALALPLAQWQQTLAINLTAPFLIIQRTLGAMKAKGWGRVINIASISGVRAGTGRLAYGTSKAALIALTRQFAIEAATWGVTVNAVAPGPIDTPLLRSLGGAGASAAADPYARLLPMRRHGTPAEVAHAVRFLASDQAGFITGDTLAVDGGFLASGLMPEIFEQHRGDSR